MHGPHSAVMDCGISGRHHGSSLRLLTCFREASGKDADKNCFL
jgi:hypothetical protein